MDTPKNLLVPTDFSTDAAHAAHRAALIARETAGRLELVHVVSTAPLDALRRLVSDIPPDIEQRLLDRERSELRSAADGIEKRHGLACGTHVTQGGLVGELIRHAEALATDLVVLGARGTSHLRRFLLGTTAERLVSRASHPCLVVKHAPHTPYRHALVAVDLSPSSLKVLRCAHAVAGKADLMVLYVFDVPFEGKLKFAGVDEEAITHFRNAARKEAMERLRALCQEAGLPPERLSLRVIQGDPSHHIIEQEHLYSCDLIVMGRNAKGALEELLLGSVARHVLAESRSDVLIAV